ncbi:MAG: sensor histidine kinase [Planctomycetota bacterium]|jgi:two-component system CheB/CheR fusion protein
MRKILEKNRIIEMFGAIIEAANGNYSCQIELSGNNDALDSLAMGFNMMIDDVRNRIGEIETQRSYMDNVITFMADALFVVSPNGIIQTVNHAACAFLDYCEHNGSTKSHNRAAVEYTPESIIGTSVYDYVPEDRRNIMRQSIEKVFRIGKPASYEVFRAGLHGPDTALYEIRLGPVLMDEKVAAVTMIFTDITERRRLEKEILEISSREQCRIGQDLHDGICQNLTGIALMSKLIEEKLEAESSSLVRDVKVVTEFIENVIEQVHALSKGLLPVPEEAEGLITALKELASNSEEMYGVSCPFKYDGGTPVKDKTIATHLYRIAQEALSNAVKHGNAEQVSITLASGNNEITLAVENDGLDFPELSGTVEGLGLNIMEYRAREIGASLDIGRKSGGGTIVRCRIRKERAE